MKNIVVSVLLILLLCSCVSKRNTESVKRPTKVEAEKNYVGHSPEECAQIQVQCIPGFERFDDEKGCGCRQKKNP
jgi:hypothetical protein